MAVKNATSRRRVVEIGRHVANSPIDLREAGTADPVAATAEIHEQERRGAGIGRQRRRQRAAARRPTGANAETTSESGATTERIGAVLAPADRMDSESLPTGIAIPSAGHNSSPSARTVS